VRLSRPPESSFYGGAQIIAIRVVTAARCPPRWLQSVADLGADDAHDPFVRHADMTKTAR